MSLLARYKELHAGLTSAQTVGETGAHSFEILSGYATDMVAKNVLEIGFNRGSSALTFLLSSEDSVVHSVDIRSFDEVRASVEFLQRQFPNRFHYYPSSSENLLNLITPPIDLVLVDGDHSYDGVLRDSGLVKQLNPRVVVYDDVCHPQHGADVTRVIREMGWWENTKIDCEAFNGTCTGCGFAVVSLSK